MVAKRVDRSDLATMTRTRGTNATGAPTKLDKRYVQAFERGLDVLAALNLFNGASIRDLAEATGLNRAIVYRLLETLRRGGYVRKDPLHPIYWLESRVRGLADGYNGEAWIDDVVRPACQTLGSEVGWPVSMLTVAGAWMTVRACSDFESSLTFEKYPVGFRVPVELTAAGRVYLAHCGPIERTQIVDAIAAERRGSDAAVRGLLHQSPIIRQRGYDTFDGQFARSPNIAGLAIPIQAGERILGSLGLRYFCRSVSSAEIIRRHLPALTRAAAEIVEQVARVDGVRRAS